MVAENQEKSLPSFGRKWDKKYLKNGDEVACWQSRYGKIVARNHFTREFIEAILKKVVAGDVESVKDEPKRAVVRVELDGQSYIVKHFRKNTLPGPWRYDRQSWLNGIRLECTEIPTPQNIALVNNGREGFLIMESGGFTNIFSYIYHRQKSYNVNHLLVQAVNIILQLQQMKCWHRDLKASNFVIDDQYNVKLIDLDNLRFNVDFSRFETLMRNLRPFICQMEMIWEKRLIKRFSLFRVLLRYSQGAEIDPKRLLNEVMRNYKGFS